MKRKKPSQTRRHRESVREKRRARAFYFERQAAKDLVEFKGSRWKALAGICRIILAGLVVGCGIILSGFATAWLSYNIIQLIRNS